MNIARVPLLLAGLLATPILSFAQTAISGKVKTVEGKSLPDKFKMNTNYKDYLSRNWKSNVFGYRYSYDGARRETIWPPAKRNFLLSFLMNLDGDEFNH